jgi:hypothetical protein
LSFCLSRLFFRLCVYPGPSVLVTLSMCFFFISVYFFFLSPCRGLSMYLFVYLSFCLSVSLSLVSLHLFLSLYLSLCFLVPRLLVLLTPCLFVSCFLCRIFSLLIGRSGA